MKNSKSAKSIAKPLANVYLGIILAVLYLPIVVIIVYSFSGTSNFTFPNGFNFDAYAAIFSSDKTPKLFAALKNTLIIAAISSVVSTVLGTFAAVGIFYLKKNVKKATLTVNQIPMINSEIVTAVSLMIFFGTFSIPQGMLRLVLGHISFCTPYVVLSVMPRLYSMNSNLYEAALDLGATPTRAMFSVVFPYILPGVISGAVMAFTISIDDFIITQINKGETGIDTLSTYIFSDARVKGLEPFWFAIFSLIFIVILTGLLLANLIRNKNKEALQS